MDPTCCDWSDPGKAVETNYKAQRKAVTHTYHDYAEENHEGEAFFGSVPPSRQLEQSFPMKLHFMLTDIEKDGLDHIVSWQVHGRCFVVRNQPQFVKSVLPL